jgi:hypothetical protein
VKISVFGTQHDFAFGHKMREAKIKESIDKNILKGEAQRKKISKFNL